MKFHDVFTAFSRRFPPVVVMSIVIVITFLILIPWWWLRTAQDRSGRILLPGGITTGINMRNNVGIVVAMSDVVSVSNPDGGHHLDLLK